MFVSFIVNIPGLPSDLSFALMRKFLDQWKKFNKFLKKSNWNCANVIGPILKLANGPNGPLIIDDPKQPTLLFWDKSLHLFHPKLVLILPLLFESLTVWN